MTKDREHWEAYKRVVKPTAAKKRKLSAAKPHALQTSAEKAAARLAASHEPVQLAKINAAPQIKKERAVLLERKREKSLRQGDIEIDAKLDLHGMTQVEAFAALGTFMQKAVKAGKRHLLIITGKGRNGTGVLRTNLSHWLDQIEQANVILALRPASLKHGGDGAFYVIMRKRT